jgi:2-keto-4-pentenoate hydratase/2-oxohepta-3-ene-1,7-dioic acid hydratase in catechol pathway
VKICRYDDDRLGLIDDGRVLDVTAALAVLPDYRWPLPLGDQLIANLASVQAEIRRIKDAVPATALDQVKLLSPVANPGKIIGAPINYAKHIDESEADGGIVSSRPISHIADWGLFLKANSALVGAGEGVALRFRAARNDHEVELAVVIGREASQIAAAGALDYVAGYAIGLDMTTRGKELQSFRKSADSYAVLGP